VKEFNEVLNELNKEYDNIKSATYYPEDVLHPKSLTILIDGANQLQQENERLKADYVMLQNARDEVENKLKNNYEIAKAFVASSEFSVNKLKKENEKLQIKCDMLIGKKIIEKDEQAKEIEIKMRPTLDLMKQIADLKSELYVKEKEKQELIEFVKNRCEETKSIMVQNNCFGGTPETLYSMGRPFYQEILNKLEGKE